MRNSLTLICILALGFAAHASLPPQGTPPKTKATQTNPALAEGRLLIRRMAKGLEGVERLHADFTQEQHTLLLDEPLRSKGKLHLRSQPGCLVMELTEPKRSLLRSDAISHQIYHPDSKRAERYLFKSNELAKSLLSVLTVNLEQLEKAFLLIGYEKQDGQELLKLQLADESKRHLVDQLELFVNAKNDQLSGVAFVNGDGERVVMRLSNVRLVTAESSEEERARNKDVFDAPLPKDVQLVVHTIPTKEAGK